MTRRMMCAAGAVLLAGLNGWASSAHAQGPMAPRMDVAPPPARVAPPPPVFVPPPVAPTPPPMPAAPVMAPPPPAPKAPTASAPATPTRLGTSPSNPTGPDKPQRNYSNQPIPGIDIVVQKKPAGNAITQTTGGDGTSTLGVLTPGTHSVVLDTKKLLDARIPGPSGSEPAQPAGILLGLLLPAVQKLGEAPQPTTVERTFPRSVLASKRELQIDIVIPDGGGSPKVNWGDGSPQTDVSRDGIPAPSGLRISADVSTIRVQNY